MPYKFNPFTGNLDEVGTGGNTNLNGLTDVTITTPSAWQVLGYNTTSGEWENTSHIHGNLAGSVYIHIKNTDSVQLDKGTPFYITGTVGASDQVEVQAADSADPLKGPAVGLVEEDLAVNGEGNGVIIGEIFQFDTATPSWSTNDALYVANTGGLTNVQPTSGYRQIVAYVGRVHASTGTLVLTGANVDPVAGSNGQVQFNDNGGFGGDAGLTYDATNGSLSVGGKTVTASEPVLDLSQTWNNAATAFTGLKFNVTNTASAAGSNLLDLQVDGTTRFSLASLSSISQRLYGNATSTYLQLGNDVVLYTGATGRAIGLSTYLGPVNISPTGYLAWPATNSTDTNPDTRLYRDDAGILAQRNGTNAQTYRLYNTYTNASDYERTSITRDSSGLVIDAQKGGTGVDPTNLLDLQVGGVTKAYIQPNGTFGIGTGLNANSFVQNGFAVNAGLALIGNNSNPINSNNSYGALVRHAQFWLNGAGYLGWSNNLVAVTTPDIALARDSAGVVKVTDGSTGTGYIKQVPVAVSALPAAATVGAGTRGFVSDANATTFASVVASGGANVVPVYSDGTDWRIG